MKKIYNEEKHRQVLEFLARKNENKVIPRMTKEEMVREIVENGLEKIRRIDFNNNNITDNIAFINFFNGKYTLIITNEKGMITTEVEFDDIEQAYSCLVRSLKKLKNFEQDFEKKTVK